jgi:hypothetical protein
VLHTFLEWELTSNGVFFHINNSTNNSIIESKGSFFLLSRKGLPKIIGQEALHSISKRRKSTGTRLFDTDQRDPKGVWPNLSRRSNKQQDTKENSI